MEQQQSDLNSLVIQQITPSKSSIKELSSKIVSIVQSGVLSPAEAAIRLSAIEQLAKEAKDAIKLDVMFDAEKWNGKIEMFGCTLQVQEYGVKYDYSSSTEWCNLTAEIDRLTEKRKAIEEIMKKIPQGKCVVDEVTGEVINGAIKTSTTSYKITLAK